MTNEQIKYSIETGEMKLGNWDKFTHYRIVISLFMIPAFFIFFQLKDYYQGTSIPFLREGGIWFMIIPSILGLLFYRLQKGRLKFKSINTKLTRDELEIIIEKLANELEWTPCVKNEKVIIAKTHPSFFSGSWGEQITILFDKNRILVNSICDPDKRSSVVSMGRNKKNMDILTGEIIKASQMTEFETAYKFKDDKETIKRLQEVSSDPESNYGLKVENGLLVGTKEWFHATEDGRLLKETLTGRISKVYMSGHNDWPEFEIESKEGFSTWTREGNDKLYQVGKLVEIDFVIQKYKRQWDMLGPTTKKVLEIRIEK
jgi:hypothetical protein